MNEPYTVIPAKAGTHGGHDAEFDPSVAVTDGFRLSPE